MKDDTTVFLVLGLSTFTLLSILGVGLTRDKPEKKGLNVQKEKQRATKSEPKKKTKDFCMGNLKGKDWKPKRYEKKEEQIFVSIASYRDDECKETIWQMFDKADRPDNIFAGVVQQNKLQKEDCFDKCEDCKKRKDSGNIRVINFDYTEARGPTFARFEASKLWRGEEYFMQIDSHTNFVKGWDTIMLEQIRNTNDAKAVLGGYPPTEDQMKLMLDGKKMVAQCKGEFNKDGVMEIKASVMDAPADDLPVPIPYCGANLIVFPGEALYEVPFDPYLSFLFFGEEILFSARLWTSGYNFYAPTKPFGMHHYGRKGKPKFWDDQNKNYEKCRKRAVRRAKFLLDLGSRQDVDPLYKTEIDEFGMGNVRTLRQYYEYTGIDTSKKKMLDMCSVTNLRKNL